MKDIKRLFRLVIGLYLFSFGEVLILQANVGLPPWSALSVGLANLFHTSIGTMTLVTSTFILLTAILLKEKFGFGSVCISLLCGVIIDFILSLGLFPMQESLLWGIGFLLAGMVSICFGSYFAIGAAYGCGPRDSLMIALGKRFRRIPIGMVRICLDGIALLTGWLLGAKVGVGTVISVFGIGLILQAIFKLFRFDPKGIKHESLIDTYGRIRAAFRRKLTAAAGIERAIEEPKEIN